MTVLFRLKNYSHQDSIAESMVNLKDKLAEYENKTSPPKNTIIQKSET
jgi:hypothetical protein